MKKTSNISHLDKKKTLLLVKSICGKVDAVKIGRGYPVLPLSFRILHLIWLQPLQNFLACNLENQKISKLTTISFEIVFSLIMYTTHFIV